jgi:hypothetical protein
MAGMHWLLLLIYTWAFLARWNALVLFIWRCRSLLEPVMSMGAQVPRAALSVKVLDGHEEEH